jgi:hypothetical protein
LRSDKLGFQAGFPIFKEHGENFMKILAELIQRFTLGVGPRETRHKADKKSGFRALLDYRRVGLHKHKISGEAERASRCGGEQRERERDGACSKDET